jgi:hypothetical protein
MQLCRDEKASGGVRSSLPHFSGHFLSLLSHSCVAARSEGFRLATLRAEFQIMMLHARPAISGGRAINNRCDRRYQN